MASTIVFRAFIIAVVLSLATSRSVQLSRRLLRSLRSVGDEFDEVTPGYEDKTTDLYSDYETTTAYPEDDEYTTETRDRYSYINEYRPTKSYICGTMKGPNFSFDVHATSQYEFTLHNVYIPSPLPKEAALDMQLASGSIIRVTEILHKASRLNVADISFPFVDAAQELRIVDPRTNKILAQMYPTCTDLPAVFNLGRLAPTSDFSSGDVFLLDEDTAVVLDVRSTMPLVFFGVTLNSAESLLKAAAYQYDEGLILQAPTGTSFLDFKSIIVRTSPDLNQISGLKIPSVERRFLASGNLVEDEKNAKFYLTAYQRAKLHY